MPDRRFWVLFVLIMLVGVLTAFPGSAGAVKKANVSGTLTFIPPSAFSGKVISKIGACESGARVNLLRYQNANDTTADKVGTDKSSKKGLWNIDVPNAQAGQFQIEILGRKVTVHDVDYKCKAFFGVRMNF